jgi:hypothetical protein
VAERIVFVTIAYTFHKFDLSFDNMDEEMGRLDGLLQHFPPKRSHGLTASMADVKKEHAV